jgi:hypothetical protein
VGNNVPTTPQHTKSDQVIRENPASRGTETLKVSKYLLTTYLHTKDGNKVGKKGVRGSFGSKVTISSAN